MRESHERPRRLFGLIPTALLTVLSAALVIMACGSYGPGQAGTPDWTAFYDAFDKGDLSAALAALPAALRDASPYTSATAHLPPSKRDEPIYFKLVADMEAPAPLSAAAASESAVHYALGVLACGQSDWEAARRRFLLALQRDPLHRMAHIYLARVYGRLEDAALKEAKEGEDPGSVLIAKVGVGSSDQHIEMAQQILDGDKREELPAFFVSFRFESGAIKDFKAEPTSASGNARIQRPAAAMEPDRCRVELRDASRAVLDEKTFPPVQIIYWDGVDERGNAIGGRDEKTSFGVSLELLSLRPAAQVVIYDPSGRKIFAAPVAAK
jgi:hypothetical protein